jgi:hypothetical protein
MPLGVWEQAAIGLLIGMIPGLLLFEWLASPFSPGLWVLSEPFTRIFLTVSQFIRGRGVLTKRTTGEYEIGTYIPEDDKHGPAVRVSDSVIPVDPDNIRWGLFGKKPFGITWEPGTDLHERIAPTDGPDPLEPITDGGDEDGHKVNMAAAHRYLKGSNDPDAIDRTVEHAKAEYGGGSDAISDKAMAGLIIVMLILGSVTGYLMVA